MSKISRRQFFGKLTYYTSAIAFGSIFVAQDAAADKHGKAKAAAAKTKAPAPKAKAGADAQCVLLDMSKKGGKDNMGKAANMAAPLKYVAKTADKAKACSACQFYTKISDSCGKCTLFPFKDGKAQIGVAPEGTCSSFVKKA